ncbi:MAG: glycosyl transferase family protein [Chloroflexi bacterium]|nr:glycosyl transferase family protein [Chloroflexota bacterium]
MENSASPVTPLLSVTVLNYNYARYLPQCIDSILSQTCSDFELILINDCSTDSSLDVIERYRGDPRVRVVNHEKNKGYIASLVEGTQLSVGKYITVISADDYCVSNQAFAKLLELLEADEKVVLAYSAHGLYGDDGIRTYLRRPHPQSRVRTGPEEFQDLVQENYILHSGAVIRAAAYHAVGGYDPSARYAPDTIMWMMLCSQGKVAYCADELFAYRVHHSNMSTSHGGIRDGLRESLEGIDKAYSALRGSAGINDSLYRQAVKRNLVAAATDNIFAGRIQNGWYAYLCGARLHPIWTVVQKRTLILLLRTVLGARYFLLLKGALQRIPRGTK